MKVMKVKSRSGYLTAGVGLAFLGLIGAANASPGHGHPSDLRTMGQPGQTSEVTRNIRVEMYDNYFDVDELGIKAGETIRFEVINKGKLVHEFALGTPAMHEAHEEMMRMMVSHGVIQGGRINQEAMHMDMGDGHSMDHDDPNSLLLEAGDAGELIWSFSEPMQNLEFACTVPGHYQVGMVGNVNFNQ